MQRQEQNLVKMANQIAGFFTSQHEDDARAGEVALIDHLRHFWAPAMRLSLLEQQATPAGDAMLPMVRQALRSHAERLVRQAPRAEGPESELSPRGGGDAG